MEPVTKTTILTFAVVAVILLLGAFGGGLQALAMTGGTAGGTMSGTAIGGTGAMSWLWIVAMLLVIVLGAALVELFCEGE